jgi:hypothetical protein
MYQGESLEKGVNISGCHVGEKYENLLRKGGKRGKCENGIKKRK